MTDKWGRVEQRKREYTAYNVDVASILLYHILCAVYADERVLRETARI
jgi:hypothetical protein